MTEPHSPPKYPAYIARCERGPVTREWLRGELAALGVRPDLLLMLHCSLSGIGYVPGGAEAVVEVLGELLGPEGTLVMPTFSSQNSEPSYWREPPVPEAWWDTVRDELPAYDPRSTPTREMGAVAEYFRSLPCILRSSHPAVSWAALGPLAQQVTAGHSLDMGLGEGSPLARCYELDGWVLSLGTLRTTILHLAEYRADWPGRPITEQGSAVLVDGQRQWLTYDYVDGWDEDFEQLRQDYMAAHPDGAVPFEWQAGTVGYGPARMFRVGPLVDLPTKWIGEHRR